MASISLICFPCSIPRLNSISNLSSISISNSNHLVIRKNFSYSSSNLKLRKDFNGVFACSTSEIRIPGGMTEIRDVRTNNEVQELGNFSVEKFNRNYNTGDPLTFLQVVEAQQQVGSGVNYYLKISAKQNEIEKSFDAVVLVPPDENKPEKLFDAVVLAPPDENEPTKLISFQPSSVPGGLTEIKDVYTNQEVQALGQFSVEEHNRNTGDRLIFLEVVEAQKRVVAGIKYYLKIKARKYGTVTLIDAVVLDPLPVEQNKKELISFLPSQVVRPGGTIEIIDVKTNNEVQEIGKFSVEVFNQKNNIYAPLAFSEVIKAQIQVVAGFKYHLKILAEQSGIPKLFDVVVVLPPGSESKELISFTPLELKRM